MSNPKFYNTSYFKFFRRQVKPIEMEKEFINLIHIKNEKDCPKTDRNIYPKEKNRNLNFYFQKHSLNLINKIRDLFIEFDEDKSNSFDQNELYQMFNINKIPIKMEEIIYLFKFNNHKKTLSFSELINLTFDPNFDKRYKEVITKIKPRCEIGIICPNDFSGMLSHLCEFGKLSSDSKNFRKKIIRTNKKINKLQKIENKSKYFFRSKTNNEIKLAKHVENNGKMENNRLGKFHKTILYKSCNERNRNRNINIPQSLTDYEFLKESEKLNKESEYILNTFKTILEITNKKLNRNENLFKNINYRNKIELSKINLINSFNTLNKINPKLSNTFISYNPLNQKFININTGNIQVFRKIEEYKNKKLKCNKTENLLNDKKPILTDASRTYNKIKYKKNIIYNFK